MILKAMEKQAKKEGVLVERTVSQWRKDRWVSDGKTLSDFRSTPAYVLLGEGGSREIHSVYGGDQA